MPACHKRQCSNTKHHARSTSRHHTRTGTDIAGQDQSHTLMDIEVTVTKIHAEVIPDHSTDATIGALHDTVTPALIAMTHHTRDHPHIDVYHLIPGIAADPDHAHHINQVRTPCLNLCPFLAGQQ